MAEQAYPPLIRNLKRLLPPTSWAWIFPAIRLDPLIWESLCNFEQVFGVQDLSALIQHTDDCTPAALALKALRYPRSPQELRILPLIPVEAAFREQVKTAESMPVLSLKEAALRALNLRQKRHASGSWNDWTTILQGTPLTALSCLFGIIPDQIEYLQALLPSLLEEDKAEKAYQRLLKVVLSNPAPLSVHSELITLLLRSLSDAEQELFLQALANLQPKLARSFSEAKVTIQRPVQAKYEYPSSAEGMLWKIKTLAKQFPAALRIFDQGKSDLKTQQLTQSIELTAQTQALMLVKLAILAEMNSEEAEAVTHWQNALRLQPHSETLRAIYFLYCAASLQVNPLNIEEKAEIHPTPKTALLRFAIQLFADSKDFSPFSQNEFEFGTFAQEALEEVESTLTSDPFLSDPEIQQYVLALLSHLLIGKAVYSLAQKALALLLRQKPNHPALLSLMAFLLHAQGKHDQALNLLHLLEGLFAEEPRLTSLLAQSHAANSEWEQALQLWKNLLTISADPQVEYETIATARFAGLESLALEQCQSKLANSPSDGILLSLLAEVDHQQSLTQRLEAHQQAVELSPSEPYVWLAYARTAHQAQDLQKALDILKAAEQTIPHNPFIQCALGEVYLESKQPSLALSHFQAAVDSVVGYQPLSINIRAFQLLVEGERLPNFIENIHLRFNVDWGSTAITFDQWYANLITRLGETLLLLGHYDEAREVLEEAYQAYPSNTQVIHQLARLNLSEGKYAEAGNILREIVSGKSSNPEVIVDFARCALQDASVASTDEVIQHLEKVLELHPDHFEALTLLAQVLGRSDQPRAALKLYDQILRFPQAREQPIRERLAFEVSQTALKAGEYEFALTTLLECDPHNLLTQQHLAETYFHLGLFQEAAQAAHIARSLNESDLATLTWYAKLFDRLAELDASHALEFYSHSIEALQKSIELAPQRSDLSLALAEALYHIGDSLRAKEILMRFTAESQSEISSTASDTEFMKAAQYLNLLGETDAALDCYQKTLTLLQASPNLDSKKAIQVLSAMAEIYRQNQRYVELKEVLEQAIHFDPNNPSLFMDFIAAWLEVNSNCGPISLADHTGLNLLTLFGDHLQQNPEEKSLALLYGLFLRWIGESTKAIEHLTQFIADLKDSDEVHSPESRLALLLAAITELSRIHRSRSEEQLADYWLEEGLRKMNWANPVPQKETTELYCDWFEAALVRGEDRSSLLFDFCNRNAEHPRVIALMSQFKISQGDHHGAKMLFEIALPSIARCDNTVTQFHPAIEKLLGYSRRLETLYTLSTVAQQLGEWNLACDLLTQALRLEPEGERAHRHRVITLVLRAEYQWVCRRLGISNHAPGDIALAEEAKRDFEIATRFLLQSCQPTQGPLPEKQELREWILRGKLVLFPQDGISQVSEGVLSVGILGASLLTASQSTLDKLLVAASRFQSDPIIQFLVALALLDSQPQEAMSLLEDLHEKLTNGTEITLPKNHWVLSRAQFVAYVGVAYALAVLHHPSLDGDRATTKRSAALDRLEKALHLYPNEANWHLLAARLSSIDLSDQENIQKAIHHLEQALQGGETSLETHLKLAQLYLFIQDTDSAIHVLENASNLMEADPQIDYWLAKAYLKHRQIELAAQYAQSAVEKNPFEPEYILLRGEIALAMQDTATALQLAEQALEQPAENPLIWGLFARALHAAGKAEDALRILKQTIPIQAEYVHLHLMRIEILHEWRGAEVALQELNALLEAFPRSVPLLLLQAELLSALGNTEAAILAAQVALRYSHQVSSPVSLDDHAHSHCLLGELFYRIGHLDQAVYHLDEAIKLSPNNEAAHLTLGDVYFARGESERALAAYQRCLDINPDNSHAYFNAAILYKELKDYPNAEQMLRQAARLEPNNLAIQRQLGAVVALNLIHTQRTKEKKAP